MARSGKSQWDFGELFTPEQVRRVFSVTELTGRLRTLIEQNFRSLWVTGEVTNFRAQSSGHVYFSLKDANAQLQCVCFRDEARDTRELLRDGQRVVLQGELSVYEPRGQYQLLVRAVELQGVGALQIAFEKLKQKLAAEGLFDPARKRPLPRCPQRIGIVTSATGAALQDVLHVIARRQPSLEVVLVASRVQGDGAGDEIATALAWLNEWACVDATGARPFEGPRLDLILVTRGGGSLEDLWAFNEEAVARAIYHSRLPVVSAVGHEIDFTISDFVADVRAATPSAAAELITEGVFSCRRVVAESAARLQQLVQRRIEAEREHQGWLQERLRRAHPRRRVQEQGQRLDDLITSLSRCTRSGLARHATGAHHLVQRLARVRPELLLRERRQEVLEFQHRLRELARLGWRGQQQHLTAVEARLRLLSPDNVLQRGYSITRDTATGQIIRAAQETQTGRHLTTRLRSGEIRSVVES